jgi:hypothetical protein
MGANRCTRVNCKGNPAICPAGWMCLDLTAFGQPSICIKN